LATFLNYSRNEGTAGEETKRPERGGHAAGREKLRRGLFHSILSEWRGEEEAFYCETGLPRDLKEKAEALRACGDWRLSAPDLRRRRRKPGRC